MRHKSRTPTGQPARRLQRRGAVAPRGMTLIELLLVLALLVTVAAFSLPALQGPLDDQKVVKAADMIRAEWARARVQAMKNGRTRMFRFQPGTTTFQIEPWYTESDYLEADLISLQTDPTMTGAAPGMGIAPGNSALSSLRGGGPSGQEVKTGELPEGVTFHAGTTSMEDSRTIAMGQSVLQLTGGDTTWSAPVLFYPDGSCSNSRLTLNNDRGAYVTVSLRGLTGLSHVSELLSAEEVMP